MDTETKWSSNHQILLRYFQLYPLISSLELADVDDLISEEQCSDVKRLCDKLSELESMEKKLQDPNTTFSDARVLFEAFLNT